ncbi:MAG: UMP kinase [Marinilabiliales bacterium]|nr:MAG: UMP kinase [Marinilabiliales bacterium]
MIKYKKVLVKLSGESLMGSGKHGIDPQSLMKYAHEVKSLTDMGVKVGLVIGGGNIFRGLKGVDKGFDRVKGDYMGMLATVINGLAMNSALESMGVGCRLLTAIRMEPVGQGYSRQLVKEALDNGEVVIFSAGTGNPFFTTDTAAALRAVEMGAELLVKGTRVDGVYTADPEKVPDATKFDEITFDEAYSRGLKIVDLTAYTLCSENGLNMVVFDVNRAGNLKRIILGERVGTLVKN